MLTRTHASNVKPLAPADRKPLMLDGAALDAARRNPPAADPPSAEDAQWRDALIALLNDALATELVCMLRYKRHHFTARGLESLKIGEEFLAHARKEAVHADRLAQRIVQLGGEPDFAPDTLSRRSHAAYDESRELRAMIEANLVAERIAVESYSQSIALVGARDPSTRRLLEDILADEQEHAEELRGWLAD
ncbi:MAG: bacterioferritin [Betaproteobacteria bacterium]